MRLPIGGVPGRKNHIRTGGLLPACHRKGDESVEMKTCVLALTEGAHALAQRIAGRLADCVYCRHEGGIAEALRCNWPRFDGLICIMSTGIVVRSIAPLLRDKTTDPCVVVVDQQGRHAISLVSGHLGGGNELARRVAEITGGTAVITTASDLLGKTAIDLWARRNELHVTERKKLIELSARQVNGAIPAVYSDLAICDLPPDFSRATEAAGADIVISYKEHMTLDALCCIPKALYMGIGCNRGTPAQEIETALAELCNGHGIDVRAFAGAATIDLKSDEVGILEFCHRRGLPLQFFSKEALNGVTEVSFSAAAMRAVGAKGVAEPAALLAAEAGQWESKLSVAKMKWHNVTLAVAERIKTRWD